MAKSTQEMPGRYAYECGCRLNTRHDHCPEHGGPFVFDYEANKHPPTPQAVNDYVKRDMLKTAAQSIQYVAQGNYYWNGLPKKLGVDGIDPELVAEARRTVNFVVADLYSISEGRAGDLRIMPSPKPETKPGTIESFMSSPEFIEYVVTTIPDYDEDAHEREQELARMFRSQYERSAACIKQVRDCPIDSVCGREFVRSLLRAIDYAKTLDQSCDHYVVGAFWQHMSVVICG